VQADAMVREASPNITYGSDALLEAADSPGASKKRSRTFLRVGVSGLAGRPVVTAQIRLQVASVVGADSNSGGRIHQVADCTWDELALTWTTQPAMSATVLSAVGAVQAGNVVAFDVTPAITGDGTYCFVIESSSTDAADYNSRESSEQKPQFVAGVAP